MKKKTKTDTSKGKKGGNEDAALSGGCVYGRGGRVSREGGGFNLKKTAQGSRERKGPLVIT